MCLDASARDTLRRLALDIRDAAALPIQEERRRLWLRSNRLQPERPMVAANPQHGWFELVREEELVCPEGFLRDVEREMRRTCFRAAHIHDDVPIEACIYLPMLIQRSDFGLSARVTKPMEAMGAYHIEPTITCEADIDKLHFPKIEIDRAQSAKRLEVLQDAIGDIIDVRLVGMDFCRCGLTRQLVHLRGLTQMMLDYYDEPEIAHRLMAFLRDALICEFEYYEEEGVLSGNTGPYNWLGSGSLGYTDALDGAQPGTMKAMSVWGESQETVGVGPDLFDEFVLAYQLPVMERFGIVEYGCCEGLDTKFDLLLKKVPHLHWAAVSPWCDRRRAAEKLERKCVYVYKPVPTPLTTDVPDMEFAERQLRETLDIARDNVVHIVMKDTSTFQGDYRRLEKWTEMAGRVVCGG